MAIVKNMWLRGVSKKIGGTVYYQQSGETRWRELAASISNPRTDAQMEQRVKLANLVAFYRASKKWMRGAFESKASNQSDYNAFVSANATDNRVCLKKSQVEAGNGIVAPYKVTQGSMGEITQTQTENAIGTNLYIGDLAITEATTIAQLSAALIAYNNGIEEGDQISIIQYIQNTSTTGNYTITCRPYEVILSLTNTQPLGDYLPASLLTSVGEVSPALGIVTSSFVGGVSFVLSRTTAARLLVSTSYVTLTYGNSVYAAMTTTTQQQAAIDSYGEATTIFLDSNLASEANSSVTTQARILTLTIDGTQYAPGSVIPHRYDDDQLIIVNLSAPVSVGEYGYLQLYARGGNPTVQADITPAAAATGNILIYKVSAPGNLPLGSTICAEIELSDDSILNTEYRTESTNGEGLS